MLLPLRTVNEWHECGTSAPLAYLQRESSAPSARSSQVKGVAFLRDASGGPALAASGSKDGEVKLWDLSSGACVATLSDLGDGVGGMVGTGGVNGLAAALPAEGGALLYAGCTSGAVLALSADIAAATLEVVAAGCEGGH